MNNDLSFIKEAIIDEYKAIQTYHTLINASNIPELKQLFAQLESDEQRHVNLLESMYYEITGESYHPNIAPMDPNKHAEELIDESIQAEIDDVAKYNKAANTTKNKRFRKIYQQIAGDENVHALRLLNLQK